jgi:large subunit ribosomal protein L24
MARTSKNLKIKAGDTVEVLSGKDRGKRGVVTRVLVADRRVVVEGVNVVKRHTKPRPAQTAQEATRPELQGGVIEKPAPIHVSNVAVVSPGSGRPGRVGYRFEATEGGATRKVRIIRRDNVDLDETKSKSN